MKTTLVLFDIDGTLIYHVGPRKWEAQYAYGFKMAYGIKTPHDYAKYNGNVEKQMAWEILQEHGISIEDFRKHYPNYITSMYEHLTLWSKKGPVFKVIKPAMELVKKLQHQEGILLGVLTGNAKRIAIWKLNHTGYEGYFSFGLYGDDADNRINLAWQVFEEAKREFHRTIAPGGYRRNRRYGSRHSLWQGNRCSDYSCDYRYAWVLGYIRSREAGSVGRVTC